jgi:hypothetical protein
MSRTKHRRHRVKASIDDAVHQAIKSIDRDLPTRGAFERLLRYVQSATPVLRTPLVNGWIQAARSQLIVSGLCALAWHHADWLRPVEDWTPTGSSPLPQFGSFAQHLFCRYSVPAFMNAVWFRDRDAESVQRQGWYKHIGLGRNIRTADLPLPYTKMMAHHFMQAPDHFSVEEALRWGQVRGMGGSKELARAVAATRLGRSFEHGDFWKTVVQFFVNEPTLDLVHIGPIVDYLHHQRSVPQALYIEEGEYDQPGPPQPRLTMKGRTKRSLLKQVDEWHKKLRYRHEPNPTHWKPSDIGEFRYAEQGWRDGVPHRNWVIRELLSSAELYREGRAMQHCVAVYARACAGRMSSIWSMRFDNGIARSRVMTIEVDMKRRMICQARHRRNAPPNGKAREIMERWARRENLAIAEHV